MITLRPKNYIIDKDILTDDGSESKNEKIFCINTSSNSEDLKIIKLTLTSDNFIHLYHNNKLCVTSEFTDFDLAIKFTQMSEDCKIICVAGINKLNLYKINQDSVSSSSSDKKKDILSLFKTIHINYSIFSNELYKFIPTENNLLFIEKTKYGYMCNVLDFFMNTITTLDDINGKISVSNEGSFLCSYDKTTLIVFNLATIDVVYKKIIANDNILSLTIDDDKNIVVLCNTKIEYINFAIDKTTTSVYIKDCKNIKKSYIQNINNKLYFYTVDSNLLFQNHKIIDNVIYETGSFNVDFGLKNDYIQLNNDGIFSIKKMENTLSFINTKLLLFITDIHCDLIKISNTFEKTKETKKIFFHNEDIEKKQTVSKDIFDLCFDKEMYIIKQFENFDTKMMLFEGETYDSIEILMKILSEPQLIFTFVELLTNSRMVYDKYKILINVYDSLIYKNNITKKYIIKIMTVFFLYTMMLITIDLPLLQKTISKLVPML